MESFTRRPNLQRHERFVHKNEKAFQCKMCLKWFSTRFIMCEHERTHTGEKPYRCDICHKSFGFRCSLHAHERRVHADTVDSLSCVNVVHATCTKSCDDFTLLDSRVQSDLCKVYYKCRYCVKLFSKRTDVTRHVVFVHDTLTDGRLCCGLCGEVFCNVGDAKRCFNGHVSSYFI